MTRSDSTHFRADRRVAGAGLSGLLGGDGGRARVEEGVGVAQLLPQALPRLQPVGNGRVSKHEMVSSSYL